MNSYWSIIDKYIDRQTLVWRIYLVHVTLVTNKALQIGRNLNLTLPQLELIEQAGMLHDIGIVKVKAPEIGCFGNLPYIQHGLEGQKILMAEGLVKESRICACHLGVGIYKEDVLRRQLPLPPEDLYPQTIEEKIIAYSDLFFSKNPSRLWQERTFAQARQKLSEYNPNRLNILTEWRKQFA